MITLELKKALKVFPNLMKAREAMLFRRLVAHAERSILDGSPVSGAPGQPWKTGNLYSSWFERGSAARQLVWFRTECYYAPIIEDNWRGATLRSKVGGFHSVKLTINGWQRIIDHELAIVDRAMEDVRGVGSTMRDPSTGKFV